MSRENVGLRNKKLACATTTIKQKLTKIQLSIFHSPVRADGLFSGNR